jgi:hypothetical protein
MQCTLHPPFFNNIYFYFITKISLIQLDNNKKNKMKRQKSPRTPIKEFVILRVIKLFYRVLKNKKVLITPRQKFIISCF